MEARHPKNWGYDNETHTPYPIDIEVLAFYNTTSRHEDVVNDWYYNEYNK